MDFTQEEKERINQLYGTDFKDITPDDALLIGRWEAWKATQNSEHQAKISAIKAESVQNLINSKMIANKAMEDLETLTKIAQQRLGAIDGA